MSTGVADRGAPRRPVGAAAAAREPPPRFCRSRRGHARSISTAERAH